MKERVKFISYDGKYPTLCSGCLVLEIDGERVTMPPFCLYSGGGISGDWEAYSGEWHVDVPDKYLELKQEITDVVNDNVTHGCCGGCI